VTANFRVTREHRHVVFALDPRLGENQAQGGRGRPLPLFWVMAAASTCSPRGVNGPVANDVTTTSRSRTGGEVPGVSSESHGTVDAVFWAGIRLRRLLRSVVFTCGILFVCASAAPDTASAMCGDGVVASPVEECDDGNTDAGDCCASDCRFEPQSTPCGLDDLCLKAGSATCDGQGGCALGNSMFCFGGPRAELWDPAEPEAEKLKIRVKGSNETDSIGDPSTGTRYEVCVYNFHESGPLTVDYRLPLPVGAGWQPTRDGFEYRRPKGAMTSVLRARVRTKMRSHEILGPYYVGAVKLTARGSALALPGAIDSSRYFDADHWISSVCVVNDLGFRIGISTWGIAINRSFVNAPDHVRWKPPRLGD
jgi:cysteine-rich repeat protein